MYKALVTKVKIMPIEGSDNIQLAYCNGYSVIVGKDVQEGDLVVFFEAGGQLTKDFALPNNLYRKHPDTGLEMGGYFEPNLRVKAIKMRGARSDGFIAPLSSFKFLGVTDKDFAEGQLFDEINGVVICKKYFTPKTLARMGEKKQRKEVKLFPKHIDTGKFKQEYKSIPVGSLITISLKLHDTSQRTAFVPIETELSGFRKFVAKIFKFPLSERRYEKVIGTRNVVLDDNRIESGTSFYGKEEFRFRCHDKINLAQNEVIYYEVVGWSGIDKPIMEPQNPTSLKDKAVAKKYGDKMVFTYNCPNGSCDFYVYRMGMINEQGMFIDYPWYKVLQRCNDLGIKPVPVIEQFIFDGDYDKLLEKVEFYTEKYTSLNESKIDSNHIEEGIVIRYDSELKSDWLKSKNFLFGLGEGYLKESDDFVDLEEIS